MKKAHIAILIIVSVTSFIIGHVTNCKEGKKNEDKTIIQQVTDERGLTSVIYKDGPDTFALDYLTRAEYDSVFNLKPVIQWSREYICPDCGEAGCIYEAIDDCCEGETDADILRAIMFVCKERNITDPKMIEIIKANYYL